MRAPARGNFFRPGPVMPIVAALFAGLAVRGFFVWHHPRFAGDTLVYGDLAHNLLAHHVYGLTEAYVRPTLIRLPGYPLFLALCFMMFGTGNYLAVVWVQVAADLLGCCLLADVARRLFGQRVGLVALWLSVLCPFTANYTAAALTETLSIFCAVLAFWGLVRWVDRLRGGGRAAGEAAWIGAAVTVAALLRPDGGLLAAAMVPAMLLAAYRERAHRRWQAVGGAVLVSAMLCAALATWGARNWRMFHVVQPLAPKYANDPGEDTPLGFARWYRTWAIGYGDTVKVYWIYDGSTLKLSDLPERAFDNARQRQQTERLFAKYNDITSATPEIDAAFAHMAAERVRAHPLRYYVLLPVAKLGDMWLRPRTELLKLPLDWWDVRAHPRRSVFEIAYAALNAGLLLLAVAGWRRGQRLRWNGYGEIALAVALLLLLRSALLLTIDNSEPRYTLECFPAVLLLASLALVRNGDAVSAALPERPWTGS
ncbi:MAG: ArnT family glycosyltransferase [Janthinobacterium lividum]